MRHVSYAARMHGNMSFMHWLARNISEMASRRRPVLSRATKEMSIGRCWRRKSKRGITWRAPENPIVHRQKSSMLRFSPGGEEMVSDRHLSTYISLYVRPVSIMRAAFLLGGLAGAACWEVIVGEGRRPGVPELSSSILPRRFFYEIFLPKSIFLYIWHLSWKLSWLSS